MSNRKVSVFNVFVLLVLSVAFAFLASGCGKGSSQTLGQNATSSEQVMPPQNSNPTEPKAVSVGPGRSDWWCFGRDSSRNRRSPIQFGWLQQIWPYFDRDREEWFRSSPAIASDGTVYIGSEHGLMYALYGWQNVASVKRVYDVGNPLEYLPEFARLRFVVRTQGDTELRTFYGDESTNRYEWDIVQDESISGYERYHLKIPIIIGTP